MTPPSQLFHCYPEDAQSIFRERKLWFSALTDLNDPFEGMPSFGALSNLFVDEALKKDFAFQHPSAPSWPDYRKTMEPQASRAALELRYAMQEKFRRMSAEHFRFYCFTGEKPNPAMWGHYADCHRGFTVEFHPHHPLFNGIEEVKYVNKRPEPAFIGDFSYLQFKDESWVREKEFRLIKQVSELDEDERPSDKKRLRYLPLPPAAVKAVYFGWQMPTETRNQMVSDLGSSPIQKFVMLPHPSAYALEPHPIDKVTLLPDDIRKSLKL